MTARQFLELLAWCAVPFYGGIAALIVVPDLVARIGDWLRDRNARILREREERQ